MGCQVKQASPADNARQKKHADHIWDANKKIKHKYITPLSRQSFKAIAHITL